MNTFLFNLCISVDELKSNAHGDIEIEYIPHPHNKDDEYVCVFVGEYAAAPIGSENASSFSCEYDFA